MLLQRLAPGRVLCIVPAYNEDPAGFARTVLALLRQTVPVDIVVIDDGWGGRFPRIDRSSPGALAATGEHRQARRAGHRAEAVRSRRLRLRADRRFRLRTVPRRLRAPAAGDVEPEGRGGHGMDLRPQPRGLVGQPRRRHRHRHVVRDDVRFAVDDRHARDDVGCARSIAPRCSTTTSTGTPWSGTGDDRWLALPIHVRGQVVGVAEALVETDMPRRR